MATLPTLAQFLARGAPRKQTLAVAAAVAQFVAEAHAREAAPTPRVVFHVLTPSNVFVLTGFREARAAINPFPLGASSTRDRSALYYTAPESFQKNAYTQASDVYSLTMLLWHILHGAVPLSQYTPAVALDEHVIAKNERPELSSTAVPAAVAEVMRRGWAVEPEQRATAAELAAALRAAFDAEFPETDGADAVAVSTEIREHQPKAAKSTRCCCAN